MCATTGEQTERSTTTSGRLRFAPLRCIVVVDKMIKKMIKRMIGCLAVTAVMAFANVIETAVIPYHGVFLKLSSFEWLMVIWIPLSALLFAKPGHATRWWLYYAVVSFLLMWPGISRGVLCTLWGRRPWMPSEHCILKFFVVLGGLCMATVVAAAIARWKHDNDEIQPIAGKAGSS